MLGSVVICAGLSSAGQCWDWSGQRLLNTAQITPLLHAAQTSRSTAQTQHPCRNGSRKPVSLLSRINATMVETRKYVCDLPTPGVFTRAIRERGKSLPGVSFAIPNPRQHASSCRNPIVFIRANRIDRGSDEKTDGARKTGAKAGAAPRDSGILVARESAGSLWVASGGSF